MRLIGQDRGRYARVVANPRARALQEVSAQKPCTYWLKFIIYIVRSFQMWMIKAAPWDETFSILSIFKILFI